MYLQAQDGFFKLFYPIFDESVVLEPFERRLIVCTWAILSKCGRILPMTLQAKTNLDY
jgi:hypothetical protein